MTCDEAEILLHALIDGELDAGHISGVEAHLASCAKCATAARDYRAGQQLRLQLDDAVMRRAAWRGYGLAWVGLLAGAGLGAAIGVAWGQYANLLTLCGLLLGTFSAVHFSKRHLPEPRLVADVPESLFPLSTSDRP